MKTISLALILAFFSVISAQANAAVVGSLKTDYNLWQTGIDGTAAGPSVGADVNISRERWFTGVGYTRVQLSGSGANRIDLERADMDVVAGYRFDPQIAAFLGYKKINVNYTNSTVSQSFDESINAVGGGANMAITLAPRVIGYGTVSVSYLMSQYEGLAAKEGSGVHVGQEGGLLYRVSNRLSVAAALKHQWLSVKYSASSSAWVSDLFRLGAHLVYRFDE